MTQVHKAEEFIRMHSLSGDGFDYEEYVEKFTADMKRGLAGEKSSLGMIPTYLSAGGMPPDGATAAVVDAGGTNFRTALVTFTEAGPIISRLEKCPMPGSREPISWEEFTDLAAEKLLPLLSFTDKIGFSFSYPTKLTPQRDGRILSLAKEVQITGYKDRLICSEIKKKLARKGCDSVKMMLLNDVPAVLLGGMDFARRRGCGGMVGLINGTGTNLCCAAPGINIGGREYENMLINVESGTFNAPGRGDIDEELDAASALPGSYIHEKTVSGAYLGELFRRALLKAAEENVFMPKTAANLQTLKSVSSEAADCFAAGERGESMESLFAPCDLEPARLIAGAVFDRAGKYICCDVAAAIEYMGTTAPVCLCGDGSVFLCSQSFRAALFRHMDCFIGGKMGKRVLIHESDHATAIGAAVAALIQTGD